MALTRARRRCSDKRLTQPGYPWPMVDAHGLCNLTRRRAWRPTVLLAVVTAAQTMAQVVAARQIAATLSVTAIVENSCIATISVASHDGVPSVETRCAFTLAGTPAQPSAQPAQVSRLRVGDILYTVLVF